ncbi:antibiotic biosynthesis monooxygenase family protein [Pseudonocardia pini]|uniref:antibiotic biosynthesis monooxygenase family protein n=1 Tax=Pseudonocardia pini TaxID=2758030 RepID=UPI0015F0F4CC|nr:antibiotic biosynthesis monooxygenase family protein [Pseudonocardia pini]
MVREIAFLTVADGAGPALESALLSVRDVLDADSGCLGFTLDRCLENPLEYVLVVEWRSLEAHTEDFRSSPDRSRFLKALLGCVSEPPRSAHYVVAVS